MMTSYIADEHPVMILTLGTTIDRAFPFSETFVHSLISCDQFVTGFKTNIYKRRLSDIGFDTTSIPKRAYLDFVDGAYRKIPVLSCTDYESFIGYRDRIVIVGEMHASGDETFSHSKEFQTPLNGTTIYAPQLLSIILNSMINRNFIVQMPFALTILPMALLFWVLVVAGHTVLIRRIHLIAKVLLFKASQATVLIGCFIIFFVLSTQFRYVVDIDACLGIVVVGGELYFWLAYFFRSAV